MEKIKYDQWRQDIVFPGGRVIPNVLFVRGTKGDRSLFTPVFDDLEQFDGIDPAEDAMDLIRMIMEKEEEDDEI